ncbi:MAG: class I SAM-dependent methyltransferase [Verrucomicrobiales bacterium]|nr:class I SAM-dependent methyltransferase [Verrucomicrobiales bacterium]
MNDQPDLPPPPLSPHRPLSEFYAAPAARQDFVNELFDEAAPDYDWVSGMMSFGRDQIYRREALKRAGLTSGMWLLDVASGTGLMIKAALELGVDPANVIGVDPSQGMLAENRKRNPVTLLEGKGEALPCADSSFDFVCMGYALRHVEDLGRLFGEFKRVLRPGGKVLILEITRPTNPVVLPLMRFYMQQLVPRIGWLRRRNKSTAKLMQYYWATIEECVPPSVIIAALAASGFKNVKRTTSNGVLSEYVAGR